MRAVLVVRQQRAPVAAPLFTRCPAGQEDVEGDREGVRVEAPTHSLGEAAVGRAGHRGGFRVFAHDESRVLGSGESAPGGGGGEDSEGEEGGPAPP